MKKICCVILCLALIFSLSACAKNPDEQIKTVLNSFQESFNKGDAYGMLDTFSPAIAKEMQSVLDLTDEAEHVGLLFNPALELTTPVTMELIVNEIAREGEAATVQCGCTLLSGEVREDMSVTFVMAQVDGGWYIVNILPKTLS